MNDLSPTTIQIIDAVVIVAFAIYVMFCLGVFGKDK
jgi:hypothetical protein